ncbi:hypothetical protein AURANDRAFT_67320 [Aureococcus anophagefferens]|uniref:Uncharacterized protein n=1 Tax=Aureococcus anophagefferens TaxID=44056 RepID=F0YKR5_AURAN|nr:hypothetical protein AURANDRAFT_67320 [Aureococcus anophagefferens]EGB04316.1 hypothetical protein AURANDRAFT_67320 [Aureococcus anophagefferens]|eukprot:XP_009041026.1 hypothetical protein AURANDRAFT_67320 [Aureococcus anophagefferens]
MVENKDQLSMVSADDLDKLSRVSDGFTAGLDKVTQQLTTTDGRLAKLQSKYDQIQTSASSPQTPAPLRQNRGSPIDKYGHYANKNKIAKNAGGRNVRDGLYAERYFIGLPTITPRNNLIISDTQKEIINANGGTAWGAILVAAGYVDWQVGMFHKVTSEGAISWKAKKYSFCMQDVDIYGYLIMHDQIRKGKPFAEFVERGYWRRGIEFYDKYRTTHVPDMLLPIPAAFFQLFIALKCLECIPFFFPKNFRKKPFKVQQAIVFCELVPNLAYAFNNLAAGVTTTSMFCKYSFLGEHPFVMGLFHQAWKSWSTFTTLLLAIMWMNEASAVKKMKAAGPIFKERKRSLLAAWLFCFVIELEVFGCDWWIGYPTFMPDASMFFTLVFPLISFVCAIFFQSQASKVAVSLMNSSNDNAAIVAFRKKMMLNLARGGIFDSCAFIAMPIAHLTAMLYVHGRGYSALFLFGDVAFRTPVSYFQVTSIEPPQIAQRNKARQNKRSDPTFSFRGPEHAEPSVSDRWTIMLAAQGIRQDHLDTLPSFVRIDKYGHYANKNKIAKNAGGRNVRDGLYAERYFIGLPTITPRNNLIISDTQKEIINANGGTAWGAILVAAGYVDWQVGMFHKVTSEGAISWKAKKYSFCMQDVDIYGYLIMHDQIRKGKPFAEFVERGYWRRGIEFYDKYRTTHVPDMLLPIPAAFFQLFIALKCLECIPFFFPKNFRKKPFKVQQAIVFCELVPNLAYAFNNLAAGVTTTSMFCKYSFLGEHPFVMGLFHQAWKSWSTFTTLLLAIMWMNEASAVKKMKAAGPIFKERKRSLLAAWLFCFVIELEVFGCDWWIGYPTFMPDASMFFTLVFPLISFVCAIFFQSQASKVAVSLMNSSNDNAAIVAFRKKMMLNLARGGIFDSCAFIAMPIAHLTAMLYVHGRGYSALFLFGDVAFRTPVSYFQVTSIEPPQIAQRNKARQNKVIGSAVRSSFSSTSSMSSSSSSMSPTSSSESSSASSSDAGNTTTASSVA